ncbi:MAG: ferredoxin domain-containing protein [Anaerovoracaceae bacterium]
MIKSEIAEKNAAKTVAELMLAAARTAPKGTGDDKIETFILEGEDKDRLCTEMKKIADETGAEFFRRDAGNIEKSPYIVFIGVKNIPIGLKGCGLCGFKDCGEMQKVGGRCAFKITDLGIAVGSAVGIAADNRMDNRIMYSAGRAAIALGLFDEAVKICYGIPITAMGKSPFYDRAEQTGILVTAKKS